MLRSNTSVIWFRGIEDINVHWRKKSRRIDIWGGLPPFFYAPKQKAINLLLNDRASQEPHPGQPHRQERSKRRLRFAPRSTAARFAPATCAAANGNRGMLNLRRHTRLGLPSLAFAPGFSLARLFPRMNVGGVALGGVPGWLWWGGRDPLILLETIQESVTG